MIEQFIPYIGALAIVIGAILTWMSAGRKAGVDESGIVFTQWKTLMESHKEDMKVLKTEFQEYKTSAEKQSQARNVEIEGLRERLNTVEDAFAVFRRESDERIRLLDDENRGLRKQISQIGKTAHEELAKVAKQSDATVAYIEELEPEARRAHEEITEHLARLDSMGDNSRGRSLQREGDKPKGEKK